MSFDPRDLKPELFFDARELAGSIADGGAIATWPNLGVGTPDFVQAVGAARPTFRQSGFNNAPCVEFDGIDDDMALNGDTSAAALKDPCLIVIHDPSAALWIGDTVLPRCYYRPNNTCGYGDSFANAPMALIRGISILTGGHGRVLNGGDDVKNIKGTHSDGIFHAVTTRIDHANQGGKLMCVIGFLRSPSAPELNAIIEWANNIWGLNVPANIQPWTPSLLDPEAEWDVMRSCENIAIGDSVSNLPDLTGNGHDAVQGTGSKQPVIATYNGRKEMLFDGIDDVLETNLDMSGWTEATIILMGRKTAANKEISVEQYKGVGDKVALIGYSDSFIYGVASNGGAAYGNVGFAFDNMSEVMSVYDGAGVGNINRMKIYANGTSQVLAFTGVIPAALAVMDTDNVNIGIYHASIYSNAYIAYISIINRAIVEGERKRLERFLALRGNITL